MDHLDSQILVALQANGRVTQQDLAIDLGITRSVAATRLKRLLAESGVSVVGFVHPYVLGNAVVAHVSIEVDAEVEPIAQEIALDPRVPFVSITAGSVPLVAELHARDQREMEDCLTRIQGIPGVVGSRVDIFRDLVLDVFRHVRAPSRHIDKIDLSLIELLRINARETYTSLARKVSISPATARTRVNQLLGDGVLRIGVIWRRPVNDNRLRLGLGIRIRGPASETVELVSNLPTINFLATTIGRFDLVATLDGSDSTTVIQALNEIRCLPGVLHLESWLHLQILKEHH